MQNQRYAKKIPAPQPIFFISILAHAAGGRVKIYFLLWEKNYYTRRAARPQKVLLKRLDNTKNLHP
jgi:hypothetical protein